MRLIGRHAARHRSIGLLQRLRRKTSNGRPRALLRSPRRDRRGDPLSRLIVDADARSSSRSAANAERFIRCVCRGLRRPSWPLVRNPDRHQSRVRRPRPRAAPRCIELPRERSELLPVGPIQADPGNPSAASARGIQLRQRSRRSCALAFAVDRAIYDHAALQKPQRRRRHSTRGRKPVAVRMISSSMRSRETAKGADRIAAGCRRSLDQLMQAWSSPAETRLDPRLELPARRQQQPAERVDENSLPADAAGGGHTGVTGGSKVLPRHKPSLRLPARTFGIALTRVSGEKPSPFGRWLRQQTARVT